MAGHGLADRLAGGGVPQPYRLIGAGGGDRTAIGAECHAADGASMASQGRPHRLAGGGFPQPHRSVIASGGDRLAVCAEGHAADRAGMARKHQDIVAGAENSLLQCSPPLICGGYP